MIDRQDLVEELVYVDSDTFSLKKYLDRFTIAPCRTALFRLIVT